MPIVATAPRAMDASHPYWFAMFAASVLGTNLGDLWARFLFPDRFSSLASLLLICAAAIWYDRRSPARYDPHAAARYDPRASARHDPHAAARHDPHAAAHDDPRPSARTEAGYWVAVVAMRAAATNLADIATHELALGYIAVSISLFGLTLITARLTNPDPANGGSPRVDFAYWSTMFIAGLFGTVAGDLIHHTIGLYMASAILCAALMALILLRDVRAPTSMVVYWLIVMSERLAGTAVGDALASHRAVALGLPIATTCSLALLLLSLWFRARIGSRPAPGIA